MKKILAIIFKKKKLNPRSRASLLPKDEMLIHYRMAHEEAMRRVLAHKKQHSFKDRMREFESDLDRHEMFKKFYKEALERK